jgi:hypothetical protein
MGDLMFLLLPVGFFALAAAYVRGCAAVVGPDVTEAAHRADVADTDRPEGGAA